MRFSAPKQTTFWIAVILAIIGVVFRYIITSVAFLFDYSFIILLIGFVILFLGTFVKGL
jgi:hypothetical protein